MTAPGMSGQLVMARRPVGLGMVLAHQWVPRRYLRCSLGLRQLHTAATLMLEQGVPLKVISEILGHSSIQVTSDIYTEVVDALKADAAARMDGIFA